MALHGDIKVNDHLIGSWRARNMGGTSDGWTKYSVTVAHTDNAGYHKVADFVLDHKAGEGALVLASKVLAEAGKYLRAPGLDINGYAIETMAGKVFRG
jgi:hypothetical protein